MYLAALVDDLLEITVIGSFSRLGYGVRRRLFGWSAPLPGAMAGRTVLLTGATSGLGREAAGELATARSASDPGRRGRGQAGARARRARRTSMARTGSRRSSSTCRRSPRSRRRPSSPREEPRLDVVIDNAGAIFPNGQVDGEGIEATLATMVVGPFALIAGLLPLLESTPGARVISVTSGGQYAQRLHLDDLAVVARPWNGTRAYARAKRAQVSLMREWTRRSPRRPTSRSSRCTRAGPTRPASRPPCRASTG